MDTAQTAITPDMPGRVGLFWCYKDCLMARPIPLHQAERRGTRLDSPEAHVRVWPRLVARHRDRFPALAVFDYDEVPRGRIILETATQTFFVYMDRTLFMSDQPERGPRPAIRAALSAEFRLAGQRVQFATDPHYNIQPWDDEPDEEA